MNTSTYATSRIDDIVARQRRSRLRDLSFSLMIALGVGLSAGALRAAAARATAPIASTPAITAPVTAALPACDVERSC
jgi:hypothetical protein